jgi:hypothetical protein
MCEPRLLKDQRVAKQVLRTLDNITASMQKADDPKGEGFKILRQAMGYCWSVAVVAWPKEGKSLMEKWFSNQNNDIRWIMKENLKKNRLVTMDGKWVKTSIKTIQMPLTRP